MGRRECRLGASAAVTFLIFHPHSLLRLLPGRGACRFIAATSVSDLARARPKKQ